jgi:hypothetical protein
MDKKWPVIAMRAGVKTGVVSAIAWALMDYASQHETRGTVEGFDAEVYAVYSGFPENEVIAVIKAMTDKGVIVDGKLTNWEKRQPKREDDSTERVREWREKKRNETQSNAPSGQEIERDKESEIDIDTEREGAPDPYDLMQSLIERLTGYPATQRDIVPTTEFVKKGIAETDIISAISFLKSVGKTPRGAADLKGSVMTAFGKRTQASVTNAPPPQITKEQILKGSYL